MEDAAIAGGVFQVPIPWGRTEAAVTPRSMKTMLAAASAGGFLFSVPVGQNGTDIEPRTTFRRIAPVFPLLRNLLICVARECAQMRLQRPATISLTKDSMAEHSRLVVTYSLFVRIDTR